MSTQLSCESYVCDARPYFPLLITAKRYWDAGSPKSIPVSEDEQKDDLTLVCMHGVGFHKEQWEPTFQHLLDLYDGTPRPGGTPRNKIREIWSIDAPNHGDSAVLNEHNLLQGGYTTTFDWQDYARCVILVITGQGRGIDVDLSKRRLVAVGHSMGATTAVLVDMISFSHPFESVILINPVLVLTEHPCFEEEKENLNKLLEGTRRRRDIWPSREQALAYFQTRLPYKNWDPRVVRIFVEHGLRDLPTPAYPDKTQGVTLKCHKLWEAASYHPPVAHIRAIDFLPVLCDAVPVHLVYGPEDIFQPRPVRQHVSTHGTKGKHKSLTHIEGAGHTVPQTHPAKLAEAIFDVLRNSSPQVPVTKRSSKL